MLELAILGSLKERPMHGYQLSREMGEALGGLWRVSYGSLYPTLRRLEREGEVETVSDEPAGSGRRKHVYRITEKGEAEFLELLQEAPGDTNSEDTRFRVRLAFFRYLQPEARIRLLERRRAALLERLNTIADSQRTTRPRDDDYTKALIDHGRSATRSDIEWLDALIEAERAKSANGDLRQSSGRGAKERRTPALHRKERAS
jgi:DNA-binding PadR family transcriptional regulator